ncbi:alkaline phosphatase family protein [Geminicoccaceae bacterium 1502E]|nr:alkaline phosphatase family protein [Geminicoccaceae bacterium 1502E]
MTGKVLVLGLDSADAALIEQWAAEGHLPTFSRLMGEGVFARIGTTAEVMHVSAWPTIYTGAMPGGHGMYHAYQVRAGSQLVHRTLPEWCALPPFWKFLDDAGKRCIVMDAFMDYPLEGFQGIQICEYGTWTWFTEPYASRPGLRREIEKRFGPYPAPEHSQQVTIPDQLRFREQMVRAAETKGRAVEWLLREHPWDMAFVTFGEPHGAGHYLWHSGDPEFPLHAPLPGVPNPLRDVYAAVDRAIAGVLEAVGDEVTVLVISGDGMGPNYSAAQHMPELLHQMGMFHAPTVGLGDEDGAPRPPQSLSAKVRGMIPLSVRQSITRCMPRSMKYKLNMKWLNADIDWALTEAFCVPNNNEGYIRLNVEGREPKGIVGRDGRYREAIEELREELGQLVNPLNGCRCAAAVHVMDETFEGPERHHLPDIVVSWDFGAKTQREIEGPRSGRIAGKAGHETPAYYTGNHRPNAFVLVRGPAVPAGGGLAAGHVVDLPATVLALLGVEAPAHFEGRSWVFSPAGQ